jgi:hypothetical protein
VGLILIQKRLSSRVAIGSITADGKVAYIKLSASTKEQIH